MPLGSNLANPPQQLQQALRSIAESGHTELLQVSRFFATKPVGYVAQPDFLNAAARVETILTAHDLLNVLQAIEIAQGRTREGPRNGPRTLDLDLLWYGKSVISTKHLTLPHPRLTQRTFVLQPLADLDPALMLPDGRSVAVALAELLN